MPSKSLNDWQTIRAAALDEFRRALAAVRNARPGRKPRAQGLKRAYAVAITSQFQGFCRDLHTECVEVIAAQVADPKIAEIVADRFLADRQLDRGNAQPSSIGSDFARFDIKLWQTIAASDPNWPADHNDLARLNLWRNAIVHEKLDAATLGGTVQVSFKSLRDWRVTCDRLAITFDGVLGSQLQGLTNGAPW